MPAFRITGTFQMGRDRQRFTKEVAAKDEKAARHILLSDMGSKHGITRPNIQVKTVVPLKPEEITNPVVKHRVGGAK